MQVSSGKSTTIKFIIDALGLKENEVAYITPTGKAAQVLVSKGNKGAVTMHRFLYDWYPKRTGGFVRKPKMSIDEKLIVIDEISMIEKDMVDRLFSYSGFHVICCGDPFQLPCIYKEQDNHILDNPHIFLDEIMRQAQESEIIRMTMDIRQGILPKPQTKSNEVQVYRKKDLSSGMLTWADQVICATNKTRIFLNNFMRELQGYSGDPQEGEKIICLKNNWDIYDSDCNNLVNGSIGYLKNPKFNSFKVPNSSKKVNLLLGDVETEEGTLFKNLIMDKDMFSSGEAQLAWEEIFKLRKNKFFDNNLIPNEFAYANCISCWKAQGSEFNKVLGFEERHPFDKEEHMRYLYTLCTRAKEKLIFILKE